MSYVCDLCRMIGILGSVELYTTVEGMKGSVINELSSEQAEDAYNNMCQIFDAIQLFYTTSSLEPVDLKGFFAEKVVLMDKLFGMGWSNRKIYKVSKYMLLEIGQVLRGVSSDLEEMLNIS